MEAREKTALRVCTEAAGTGRVRGTRGAGGNYAMLWGWL